MITVLARNGIHNADTLERAATQVGVPLHIAAAMIQKESNGLNVYGNDRGGVYSVGDPARPNPNVVTAENYRVFESRVLAGETSNGVGPAQITWPGFIRDAKERGIPLWEPLPNMVYGLTLLRDYLGGDYSAESIVRAGTRYNGARPYGEDLAAKARAWDTLLKEANMLLPFPAANQMHTAGFWQELERVFSQMRYDVYCGPSYVQRGFCRPGRHPHGTNSRHFAGRALDVGYDPPNGAPESDYEKSFLDVTVRMMQARYPRMLVVWNRGPGDHRDHAHFDDQSGYPMEGTFTGIRLPNGIIGFGMNGAGVQRMQRNLNANGARLTEDGIFGLGTFDALRRYQYSKGLVPDGLHGPATEATFYTTPTPPPAPRPEPTPPAPPKAPEPTLEQRLEALRVAGTDRYRTAVALNAWTPPSGTGVLLVGDGTPDVYSAVAISGRHPNVHILPVRASGSLPGPVRARIAELRPAWVRAAGGPSVVPAEVLAEALDTVNIRY